MGRLRAERFSITAAHYLALAEMMVCEFGIANRRLVNVVQDELPRVRWLRDYELVAKQT